MKNEQANVKLTKTSQSTLYFDSGYMTHLLTVSFFNPSVVSSFTASVYSFLSSLDINNYILRIDFFIFNQDYNDFLIGSNGSAKS